VFVYPYAAIGWEDVDWVHQDRGQLRSPVKKARLCGFHLMLKEEVVVLFDVRCEGQSSFECQGNSVLPRTVS
jgi:hypothetical protein